MKPFFLPLTLVAMLALALTGTAGFAQPPGDVKPGEVKQEGSAPVPGADGSEARRGGQRRHGLDARLDRPGAAHGAGPGPVLRRHGPPQERPGHHDAQHGRPGHHRRPVGAVRLRPGLRRSRTAASSAGTPTSSACTASAPTDLFPGTNIPDLRPLHVPGHVRHHHAGPDQRGRRRAHPVRARTACSSSCGRRWSTTRWPTGSGRVDGRRRLATPAGWLGASMGALDFAGGTVVHIAAGFSGLAAILRAAQAHRLPRARHAPQQHGADADRAPACSGSAGSASTAAAPCTATPWPASALTASQVGGRRGRR